MTGPQMHRHPRMAIVARARLHPRRPCGRCRSQRPRCFSSGWARTVIGPLWLTAIAWTVIAANAHTLWRGFHHGDWSAFRGYEFPGDGDGFDWSTQSGAYAFMRIAEEHERPDARGRRLVEESRSPSSARGLFFVG